MALNTVEGPRKDGNLIIEDVWYEDSDDLQQGEAVCYNTNFAGAGASAFDGRRGNHVVRPNRVNNGSFAGVTLDNYSGQTNGRRIRIAIPGSKGAVIAIGSSTDPAWNTNQIWSFIAGDEGSHRGRFYPTNVRGRGSAVVRQNADFNLLSNVGDGNWSLSADGLTLTIPDTALASVDDTVALYGGEDNGTGAVVPGTYRIAAIPTATTITLASAAVTANAGAALNAAGLIYTGNPKVQADLLTGKESGGVELLSLPNVGGSVDYMPGGVTNVLGVNGLATLAARADVELASTLVHRGDRKEFNVLADVTGNVFAVDLVVPGFQKDGITALNEIAAMDALGDGCILEFHGYNWFAIDLNGDALQA